MIALGNNEEKFANSNKQELYKHILAIVDQAPANRSHWISVADSFRIPYWDWALGDNGGEIPDFFTRPFIQATDPSGNRRTIANPLFNFQFHPVDPGFADKVCLRSVLNESS